MKQKNSVFHVFFFVICKPLFAFCLKFNLKFLVLVNKGVIYFLLGLGDFSPSRYLLVAKTHVSKKTRPRVKCLMN